MRVSEGGRYFIITGSMFARYLRLGCIIETTQKIGILNNDFSIIAQEPSGELIFSDKADFVPSVSIASTWRAWEREWLLSVSEGELQLQKAHLPDSDEPVESFLDRAARVKRERETALFIEALEWKSTRGAKTGQNSIRWVSWDHYCEMANAFGKPIISQPVR